MKRLTITLLILTSISVVRSQGGGQYAISHSVIAGGGAESDGGSFTVAGTIGQHAAGTTSTGSAFGLHGGFWMPVALAPTAARVTIQGEVRTDGRLDHQRITIVLSDPVTGETWISRPNAFGYFAFEQTEVGRFYVVQAQSPTYEFTPETHAFQLVDSLSGIDFIAVPRPQ